MNKTFNWKVGSGTITLSYEGSGTGTISVTCTENTGGGRNQEVTIKTSTSPVLIRTLRIYQEGIASYDGGISTTKNFNKGLNCSVSDSTYISGTDTLCDCGGA